MSEGNGEPFGGAESFTRMWTEFASKMTSAGVMFSPDAPPPEAARAVRNAMFDAMSSYCESYMRSPQFLEMTKQSMDGAIGFRKQLNSFMTRMQHEVQGVAQEDMDSVISTLKYLQSSVVERLDSISDRLDGIADRVEAMERKGGATARPGIKSGGSSKVRPKAVKKPTKSTKTTKTTKKRTKR